jgi:hypothetical protein
LPGFATVVTDDTAPEWLVDHDAPALTPIDGGVYAATFNRIVVGVTDEESGVVSVITDIDGVPYSLVLAMGDAYLGVWGCTIPGLSMGSHTVSHNATNGVGLSTFYSGSFFIGSVAFTGDWYVGDTLITSSSQTVYSQSLTLTFRFVKTSGVPDSAIHCFIIEGTSTLVSLTYQGNSVWTGSYAFTGGTHVLQLRGSDGANLVTMSTLSINFGGTPISYYQLAMVGGAGCIVAGGYGLLKKKKS